MSVETLMALSHSLNMSLDYIIFGNESVNNVQKHQDEISAILDILDTCPDKKRDYALRLLKLFIAACNN